MQKSEKLPAPVRNEATPTNDTTSAAQVDGWPAPNAASGPQPAGSRPQQQTGWHEEAGTSSRRADTQGDAFAVLEPGTGAGFDEDALLGRRLNDTYLVESVLGEGGMGKVYRASHTRIPQKHFALKVLRPDLSRDADQLARFQREAETAACIDHPNVIGVYDVGRTPDGWSYLVCELLVGHDLDEHLERSPRMSVQAAVHIAKQVCEALEAAHAESVVHRDLKPQNVFLLAESDGAVPEFPRVKVLDFGLSRFLDTADTQLTRTGVVMGTPAYMAPEQANGQRVDHRVDIYGIGVLLYSMLTGREPFAEETLNATLLAVLTREPTRPRSLNPEVPEDLELVIQRAMAKKAEGRFATVTEVRHALEAFEPAARAAQPQPGSALQPASVRKGSRARLSSEAYEVSTARARLLVYLAVAALSGVAACMSAVSGVELFTGPLQFTHTELALLLLGIGGTLLMPVALAVRHFHKTVWGSSAKVLDLLEVVRGPVVVALVALGLAGLGVRFADDVVGRFAWSGLLGPQPGLGWAGWTWLFPVVAGVAAATSHARQRWGRGEISDVRRHLLGAPLIALSTLVCAGVLIAGARWRSASAPPASAAVAGTGAGSVTARGAGAPAGADEPAAEVKSATDAELTAAMAQGVDGLLPLSEQYPNDRRVLEPLMMAFASRATSIVDAMEVAERLFEVAPEKAGEETVGILVKRGAQTPGSASEQAFELMAQHMGSRGPDLLYELWLSQPKLKERAAELLADPKVVERSTPALRVAYELRLADSCEARVPLLERARLLGDERSVAVLSPLTVGSKKGCGKWKHLPCPAACAAQATAYLDAIRGITQRMAATERR